MKRAATLFTTRVGFNSSRYFLHGRYASTKIQDLKKIIDEANKKVIDIYNRPDLILEDIRPAREVIPALNGKDKLVLVSGPPVTWKDMCGAQRGAVQGMIMLEGWAKTAEEAAKLCESGQVKIEPNHAHDCCGPMAGTVTPSFPVYVVRNRTFGNVAFARPADLSQQFGDYKDLKDVRWWRDSVAPSLGLALRKNGGLPLNQLHQYALEMGDESHNRNSAFTALFSNSLAIQMIKAGIGNDKIIPILEWYNWTTWNKGSGVRACLGLVMASAKACLDPAKGVKNSTLITCLARNGFEFGMKVADTGDEWYTHQSPIPEGKFFAPYTQEDAGRDMGDSAITESNGWGSNVLNGAYAFLKAIPVDVAKANLITEENKMLMIARSKVWQAPHYDFEGIPIGLDIRRVLNQKLLPWINTGITHKDAGHRVIGRGLSRPPVELFENAAAAYAKKYGVTVEEFLRTEHHGEEHIDSKHQNKEDA